MNVETGKIIHVDSRGYCLIAHSGGTYRAGCRRDWSREQALAHWGGPGYPNLERGAGFVAAIERDEEISELPEELECLFLGGGLLPAGVALPEGLRELSLGGGTLPEGVVLPKGLLVLSLGGGTLPEGTVLPEGPLALYLDGGTLPKGVVLPKGLLRLYLGGGLLPAGVALPEGVVLPKLVTLYR